MTRKWTAWGVWSTACLFSFRHVPRCAHAVACLNQPGLNNSRNVHAMKLVKDSLKTYSIEEYNRLLKYYYFTDWGRAQLCFDNLACTAKKCFFWFLSILLLDYLAITNHKFDNNFTQFWWSEKNFFNKQNRNFQAVKFLAFNQNL